MASSSFKIMSAILILSLMVPNTMATEYLVGGTNGWNVGVNLNVWLGLKIIRVGDIFHFKFQAPHTVAVVSAAACLACDATNALVDVTGDFSFTFTHPGIFGFISTGPNDCAAGLKLLVTVI